MMVSATPQTVAGLVTNCAPRLIFADSAGQAAQGNLVAVSLDSLLTDIGDITIGPMPVIAPQDGFNIIYSSGTTGAPKGIMHDHRFRGRQRVRMSGFGFDHTARLLVSTPLYSNTMLEALLPLLADGGTVAFITKGSIRISYAHGLTGRIPAAAARTARGVGCLGSTAR